MLSQLTLRNRILSIALLGAVGVVLVGSVAYVGLERGTTATARLAETNSVQRAQMDADMMHDAIRADVFDAMLAARANDPARRERAAGNLEKHAARFRQQLAKMVAGTRNEPLRGVQPRIEPLVDVYVTAASSIVEQAASDTASLAAVAARMPAFGEAFGRLEVEMEKSGDIIEAGAMAERAASASALAATRTILVTGALLTMTLLVVASFAVERRLTLSIRAVGDRVRQLHDHCIEDLRAAVQGLADGDLTRSFSLFTQPLPVESDDEVGRLSITVNDIIAKTRATVTGFEEACASLRRVITETNALASKARDGRLDERGDEMAHAGSYRELVRSINATMEAVVAPMYESGLVLDRLAGQDLTARVRGQYRGDHALVAVALNTAIERLSASLGAVSRTAEGVAASAAQIQSGSENLALGATGQATSLEVVSASARELAAMTKQNAASAAEGRSLSEAARASTKEGVLEVKRLADAIARIKASSEATAKIIRTIDEIAFQTNLLALNAAVEAARAGESGRGFAVVADEVRNLAMRSAEAAQNTATLIEESVRSTELGVTINSQVLKRLSEIDDRVNRVGQVVAEIAVASDEQAKGVEHIDRALDEMAERTQGVATTAEESETASRALKTQSAELRELVAEFRLDAVAEGRGAIPAGRVAPERRPVPVSLGGGSRDGRRPGPTSAPTGGSATSPPKPRTERRAEVLSTSAPPSARPAVPARSPATGPSAERRPKIQAEISIPLDEDDWNTVQSF